jgi:hypothetical protein
MPAPATAPARPLALGQPLGRYAPLEAQLLDLSSNPPPGWNQVSPISRDGQIILSAALAAETATTFAPNRLVVIDLILFGHIGMSLRYKPRAIGRHPGIDDEGYLRLSVAQTEQFLVARRRKDLMGILAVVRDCLISSSPARTRSTVPWVTNPAPMPPTVQTELPSVQCACSFCSKALIYPQEVFFSGREARPACIECIENRYWAQREVAREQADALALEENIAAGQYEDDTDDSGSNNAYGDYSELDGYEEEGGEYEDYSDKPIDEYDPTMDKERLASPSEFGAEYDPDEFEPGDYESDEDYDGDEGIPYDDEDAS